MTRGAPKICLHCGFKHWPAYRAWVRESEKFTPIKCERCKRDMSAAPQSDTETVYINGRMVERKKQ